MQKLFLDQNHKLWKRTSIYMTQKFKTSLTFLQNDQVFLPITELKFRSMNTPYPQEKEEVTSESLSAILVYWKGSLTTFKVLPVSALPTPAIKLALES
jgi:hypothetical protein